MKSELFMRIIEMITWNDQSDMVSSSNSCIFPEFTETEYVLNMCCVPTGTPRGTGDRRSRHLCVYVIMFIV